MRSSDHCGLGQREDLRKGTERQMVALRLFRAVVTHLSGSFGVGEGLLYIKAVPIWNRSGAGGLLGYAMRKKFGRWSDQVESRVRASNTRGRRRRQGRGQRSGGRGCLGGKCERPLRLAKNRSDWPGQPGELTAGVRRMERSKEVPYWVV